jgi:N-acetylmuramoyl-L-alanine amidase
MPSKSDAKVTGKDLLKLAASKIGQEYILGARVDMNDPLWDGPWDCAEFVTWVIFRKTGHLYGVTEENDPWTGAWMDDMLAGRVHRIPLALAIKTPGAILLRRNKRGGHIAFSCGNGKTIEARGHDYGVCSASADPDTRGWMYGILVPGVEY